MPVVKVPGREMQLGGETYVLAPITAGPLKQLLPRMRSLDPTDLEAALDLAVDLAHASLRRNYPEITREKVADDLIDAANCGAVIAACAGASGLVPQEPSPGEALPGT